MVSQIKKIKQNDIVWESCARKNNFKLQTKWKSKTENTLWGLQKSPSICTLSFPPNITRMNNPRVRSCSAHVRREEEMINIYKTSNRKYVGGKLGNVLTYKRCVPCPLSVLHNVSHNKIHLSYHDWLLRSPSSWDVNLLAAELFFSILAHPVYKMWIIQENKL